MSMVFSEPTNKNYLHIAFFDDRIVMLLLSYLVICFMEVFIYMIKKQILGITGAVFLLIGVFAPMIRIPLLGNISFFENNKFTGVLIIILALVSLFFGFTKRLRLLWFSGVASLAVMGYTAWEAQRPLSSIKSKTSKILGEKLTDKITDKITDKAMGYVHIQWGLIFLVLGLILIIIAAALPMAKKVAVQDVQPTNSDSSDTQN